MFRARHPICTVRPLPDTSHRLSSASGRHRIRSSSAPSPSMRAPCSLALLIESRQAHVGPCPQHQGFHCRLVLLVHACCVRYQLYCELSKQRSIRANICQVNAGRRLSSGIFRCPTNCTDSIARTDEIVKLELRLVI